MKKRLYAIYYNNAGFVAVTQEYLTEKQVNKLKDSGILTFYGAIVDIQEVQEEAQDLEWRKIKGV